MKNKLVETYNVPEGLLVIAGYPKRREKYSQNVCAVSSFTKNTLDSLSFENPGRKIVVLTTQINGKQIYEEDNRLIIRCFKRNSPLSYLALLETIRKFNKVKKVLVEFEFASFGNTLTTSLLLFVIWTLFAMGKRITLVTHQVLFNLRDLSGHIGLAKKNPLISFFNLGLKLFFIFLTFPASKVVVLEEEFKQRLSTLIGNTKIAVIPHGVDMNIKKADPLLSRKSLGISKNDFVILVFGYVTWYKGVDFLLDSFKNISILNGRRIKLLVAGGPSFTQRDKKHYKNYFSKLLAKLKHAPNVIYTDFIKEEDFGKIFASSDLVVLPYRVFMSSSGPLSLALSQSKPFLLSRNLQAIEKSFDFKTALETSGVKKDNIFFAMENEDLLSKVKASMNPSSMEKMINFSNILAGKRSFGNLASIYDRILTEREALSAAFSKA